MKLTYIVKEANYYRKVTGLSRAVKKFILTQTFLSKFVNNPLYNKLYTNAINKKSGKIGPSILQIENTNICNAKCIMCPHMIMKRKQKTMNQEDFEKIIDNVLKSYDIKRLTLNGFGEPFVDKKIIDKIKYVNRKYPQIKVDIYSNASLLDKETADELLKTNLDRITFSINGTRNNYEKIMNLEYDNTMKKVMYFLIENRRRRRILTNLSLMILDDNKEDVNNFIKKWSKISDSVRVYPPNDWAGGVKNIINTTPFKINRRWPCFFLFSNITIDVEGNVIMCCRDYESTVVFGNLLKQSIKEIRNSEKFKRLLKMQLNRDYNTAVCKDCDNRFESSLDWIC